jgi:hypothetical protein
VHGAFGPDFVIVIFPWLLDALRFVGPELTTALDGVGSAAGSVDVSTIQDTSGTGYYLVGAINTILTIRGGRKEREQKKQDARLKKLVAEQALDIDILKEVSRGNF